LRRSRQGNVAELLGSCDFRLFTLADTRVVTLIRLIPVASSLPEAGSKADPKIRQRVGVSGRTCCKSSRRAAGTLAAQDQL